MKTTEFIEKVEALGYEVKITGCTESVVEVRNKVGLIVFDIDISDDWGIDSDYHAFRNMFWLYKKELMRIVCEFLLTDPADREEEKRYRLLSVSPMLRKNECGYLLYHREYDKYYTGNTDHWGLVYQTIFTESEIAEMDITGFEKIRVME